MKKSLSVLLLVCTILIGGAAVADEVPFDDEDRRVIQIIDLAVSLGQQYHDSIWPGYNLNEIPLILYRTDIYALLVNAPETVEGFLPYPSNWPVLPTAVQYYPGQYQDLVGQLSFDYAINDFKATAVAYDKQSLLYFVKFLIHENFHQFQRDNFGEIPWAREELYPIEDAANLALASVEVQLLRDIIHRTQISSPEDIRPLVAEFVALRNYHWQTAPAYVARYEQGQEINEGTAKYVEMKGVSFLSRLKNADNFELPEDSLDFAQALIDNFDYILAGGVVEIEHLSRNRIYPVGASEGYLADMFNADWKSRAQKAGEEFRFDKILADAINYDSTKSESYLAKTLSNYNYHLLLSRASKKIEVYKNSFDSVQAEFEGQPGRKIIFKLSGRNLSRSRESIAKKWIIDNGAKELRDHYKIYFLKRTDNVKLSFQLKESGLLEMTNWKNRDKSLQFFCQNLESLELDGSRCEPENNLEQQFSTLKITGNNFELETAKPGLLTITENLISIDLLQ